MKKLKDLFKNKKKAELQSLNKWNFVAAGLYVVQAILILVLSGNASMPLTTNYLAVDPLLSSGGETVRTAGTSRLFDVNFAWLLAGMLLVAAILHLVVATKYRKHYEADLKKGANLSRWVIYGVIGSFVMVVIAGLSGVYDLSSLILIIAVTVFAAAFGIVNDLWAQSGKKVAKLVQVNAIKAAVLPWIVIAIYVWGSIVYGRASIPNFVYWIYLSLVVAQGLVVANVYMQRKKQGKWANYMYGEQVSLVLLFVMQTLLTWQVFFGTLR